MKSSHLLVAVLMALGACSNSEPSPDMARSDMTPGKAKAIIATMTNASPNTLLTYPLYADGSVGLTPQMLDLGGNGGAAGNAHGIVANNGIGAAVNTGSNSVTLFKIGADGKPIQVQILDTIAAPVSVAFDPTGGRLYVLGSDHVASHPLKTDGTRTYAAADMTASLGLAGVSGDIVFVNATTLAVSERGSDTPAPGTGAVELFSLANTGALTGAAGHSVNLSNRRTPLGMTASNGFLIATIAHANLLLVIKDDGTVINTYTSGQPADCWLTNLDDGEIIAANTGGRSMSSYWIDGQGNMTLIQDVAASSIDLLAGPSDIAASGTSVATLVHRATVGSYLLVYQDQDGRLTERGRVTLPATAMAADGVAIIPMD